MNRNRDKIEPRAYHNVCETLTTQDWINAARSILIREGIGAVKIDRIAREYHVTRGGFYWRFKDREELLDALLENWKISNTAPLLAALTGSGSVADRFESAALLWIEEKDFNPRFDTAVRNWALNSIKVAEEVKKIDDIRINAFCTLFLEAGYSADEALVRARIVYFHQVGYYALNLVEDARERRRLTPYYFKILSGFDLI